MPLQKALGDYYAPWTSYLQTQGDPARDVLHYVRAHRYKSVPLRIARSGALEVETEVGSKRYSFVVDTGGFATLISLKVAAQTGVPVLGTTVLMA